MKQLLLRVPDDLHRRLAARAAEQGRSVNALASEILDTATEGEAADRRSRLRARAAALGMLESRPAPAVTAGRRRKILDGTRSWGPIADELISYERDRL